MAGEKEEVEEERRPASLLDGSGNAKLLEGVLTDLIMARSEGSNFGKDSDLSDPVDDIFCTLFCRMSSSSLLQIGLEPCELS